MSARRHGGSGTGLLPVLPLVLLLTMAAPAGAHESLSQLIARYRVFVEPLRGMAAEERAPLAKEFFKTIPWDNVRFLCFEGSAGVGPDSTSIVQWIVQYLLEVEPPPADDLIDFFEDPHYVLPCKEPIVIWSRVNREGLSAEVRERFAASFLRTTGTLDLPRPFRERLFKGAAAVSTGDQVMALMMGKARSDDESEARLGLRMLAASIDPRAADSLAAMMRALRASSSPLYDVAIDRCRGACAEKAFDLLAASFREPWSPRQRLRSLVTLAQVPGRATAEVILEGYADGGVIADSTSAAEGEDRARYYELWLATRAAEPQLLEWMRAGTEDEARLALELLDRALRFGPADNDDAVVEALAELALRASGELAERARAVRERALQPPQAGGR